MIGTTRSRVSYFMNKFRKLGLISYNGKIEVHNSLLNAVLLEKPALERDDPQAKSNSQLLDEQPPNKQKPRWLAGFLQFRVPTLCRRLRT
jgi:hypothetical protein